MRVDAADTVFSGVDTLGNEGRCSYNNIYNFTFFIFYKMKELNIIQSKLNAPKDLKNNFGNYFYRSCESILRALKPLLEETKCTLTITDEVVQVGERFYVKATATLKNEAGEIETTSAFAREPINKKGMDDSQVTGATSSYARKYALNGLFAIDDSRDSDVTNNGDAANSTAGGKGANKELNAAIKELALAKNEQELQAVWYKYPQFSNVNVFVAAYQQNNNKFIYGK